MSSHDYLVLCRQDYTFSSNLKAVPPVPPIQTWWGGGTSPEASVQGQGGDQSRGIKNPDMITLEGFLGDASGSRGSPPAWITLNVYMVQGDASLRSRFLLKKTHENKFLKKYFCHFGACSLETWPSSATDFAPCIHEDLHHPLRSIQRVFRLHVDVSKKRGLGMTHGNDVLYG